jgi:hypothetical protein
MSFGKGKTMKDKMEIIENVHDNPELMEVQE